MKETLVEYLFDLRNIEDKGITYIYGENNEDFVSYHEIYIQSKKMAKYLEKVPYDKFLLQTRSLKDYIFTVWACLYAKKVLIPVKFRDNEEDVKRILSILKMSEKIGIVLDDDDKLLTGSLVEERKIIYQEMFEKNVDIAYDVCEKSQKEDPILIQFSSGSTGNPKGVITTNSNLICNMDCLIKQNNYEVIDKEINAKVIDWIPLTHNLGLIVGHFDTVMRGIDEFIIPTKVYVSNPMLLLEKIDEYRITAFHSPNFGMDLITKCAQNYNGRQLDLSCLTSISIGSERVSEQSMEAFISTLSKFKLPPTSVQPGYGLSEATVLVSEAKNRYFSTRYVDRNHLSIGDKVVELQKDSKDSIAFVELGRVLSCLEVCIMDDESQNLGEGYVGRVKLKGPTISPGYYKGEEIIEPLDLDENGWLDTGDLGYIIDSFLTIIGRSKEIMIVNGKNLYPSDFETVVFDTLNVPKSFISVTGVYNEKIKTDEIIVFIKKIPDIAIDEIKGKVKKAVKEKSGYNVTDVVFIDEIPKTSNGKVQRYKLIHMYQEMQKATAEGDRKKRKRLVGQVMKIIREQLEDDMIEATDDISDYNISSIYIIRIIDKIKQVLHYNASVKQWIASETFYDFIKDLEECEKDESLNKELDPFAEFELSSIQMAYYLGRSSDFELGNISTHAYLEVETGLNMEKLNKSLQKVIEVQPMLRTVVTSEGMQHVLKNVEDYEILIVDASSYSDEKKERTLLEERNKSENHIFNPEKWPLFEIKAVKLKENLHRLMFSIDMLVADGASIQLIFKQLLEAYNGETLYHKQIAFKDYIMYMKTQRGKAKYKKDKAFWQEKVGTMASPAILPMKTRISEIEFPKFKRKTYSFDREKWNTILEIVDEKKVRITSVLLYVYAIVLGKWSNQKNLTISTTVFNRPQINQDINELIGDFTTLLLISVDLEKEKDFFEAARLVQDELLTNLEHVGYDGVNVIHDYCTCHNISFKSAAMPIVFTSMLFGTESKATQAINKIGEVKYAVSQTSQVMLDYQIVENDAGVLITWDYVENLLDDCVIDQMFNYYIEILNNIAKEKPNEKLKDSSLIAKYEIYNDTKQDIEKTTLHGMFKQQAAKTPNNMAVKLNDKSISYQELDKQSDKIAYYLIQKGAKRGTFVAVMTERTIESIISIFGILKTGAAYVPINNEYPEERIAFIEKEIEAIDILYSEKCKNILAGTKEYSMHEFIFDNTGDIAYIIYTSGSTGTPKGVVIKHSAVANTIQDINQRFKVGEEDRVIGLSSLSFDLSVYDVFGALSCGAGLVLVEEQRDMEEIDHIIKDDKITIWNSVPMIMEMYMHYLDETIDEVIDFDRIPEVRAVLMSGDWIPVNLPERIREKFIDCEIYSLGGATEGSIWSIYFQIKEVDSVWTSIPYGYPLSNQTYYVMSQDLELCPIGVKGDLYIGGVGLADGYYKDIEKTRQSFVIHEQYGRIYKTGDVGKMTSNGWIEFLGREDSQVKVRGYRIELSEVESELLNCDKVTRAVVISTKNEQEVSYLSGFLMSDEILDINHIRSLLHEILPEYMIPEYLIQVDEIPLSGNGKVDIKKLQQMQKENDTKPVFGDGEQVKTEAEKMLVEIWKDTLNKEKVNIYRNFFEEGGNSILTIRLIVQIEKKFGIKINFKTFLKNCTIKELALVLEKEAGKSLLSGESLEKLDENVIKLSGGVHDSNAYLVKEGDEAVLIDAGVRAEFIEKVAKEEGCTIKAIILTHAHYDHIFYAEEMKNKSSSYFIIHSKEKAFLEDSYLNGMDAAGRTIKISAEDILMQKDEDVITVGSIKFFCYIVPGHTPGSMCIKYKDFLFTGDALIPDNGEVPDLHYGNVEQLKESRWNIIQNFNAENLVCSGHGNVRKLGLLKN